MLKERDLVISVLNENLLTAQNRMKNQADIHHCEMKFKVGDKVYLKIRPYRQLSLARKHCEKLAPKFCGSYRVIEEIGEVADRLDHPLEAMIHNMFHISQLKLKFGRTQHIQHLPLALAEEFELQVELETLLGVGWNNKIRANDWLVKWKGLHDNEVTWSSFML